MTPSLPALELQFRRQGNTLPTVEEQLGELYGFYRAIYSYSPIFHEWLLSSSKGLSDALLYRAFDEHGPTAAALAVIKTKTKNTHDIRSISLWNGKLNEEDGAVLSSRCNVIGRPDAVKFALTLNPQVSDWQTGVEWLQAALAIWPALFATFGPFWYNEKRVFKDRPGVSWMLYLPRKLTAQDVPEARRLVPVIRNGKEQLGTIIVSVVDEPFSLDNPEHIRIANDIEIRLVDQDKLPRFSDL